MLILRTPLGIIMPSFIWQIHIPVLIEILALGTVVGLWLTQTLGSTANSPADCGQSEPK